MRLQCKSSQASHNDSLIRLMAMLIVHEVDKEECILRVIYRRAYIGITVAELIESRSHESSDTEYSCSYASMLLVRFLK